ncbi:ANTAR domain-containing response regulator [Pseudooceanicola onchidii]|uniref:ANTAR domain-containing response regulator n=1 Tax=Pseudooceanicola onchidii TaxID=2562279 RepID=UPI0010AB4140|nr:ANTAR domain-containing protein [Pseudooceanicola onchidii]
MANQLSILVVESDRDRALQIVDGLGGGDQFAISVISESSGLARRVAELNPDVVLIDLESPSRDILEELASASGPLERPVAMFVDRSDDGLTRAAVEAGVSAYVVDGLQTHRIRPVLDAAISRFSVFKRMRTELETTKRALEERKVIDRAKGILMKSKGLSEEEAYAMLRKTAMDRGRRLSDVAEALVTAAGLLS